MYFKDLLPISIKDISKTLVLILIAYLICFALQPISVSDYHVPLIFVLAVMLISRYTDGYLYGTVASLASIFFVNYVFTYPYSAINFSIAGYPLTFVSMFTVSVIICTLTTRVKVQEQARLENEKEKIRANLLRAISHDLRTPLTSIVGSVSAVNENIDNLPKEKQSELLSNAKEEAEWLIRIVENLLSVTRIGDNPAHIKKQLWAAEEVIADAVGKFKKHYPDVSVSVSVPNDLLMVPMDAVLIGQVIINLLYNAIIHGKQAEGVSVFAIHAGSSAIFTVKDEGIGFPAGYDITNSTGIGLSVCRSIINAHGGNMTAGNGPNGGAYVKFTLPLPFVASVPPESEESTS